MRFFERAERSPARVSLEGVNEGPAAAAHARLMHQAGRQPQSKLERAAERTVAESQCVVDGQHGEPDPRHLGGAAEHACLVVLCALQQAASVVKDGDRSHVAGGDGS